MIVTPLALDGLDDNGANVDVALLDELANLALGLLFALDHVCLALGFRYREVDAWTRDARPVKFRKQVRLTRIRIGQAHRVTAPSMECATEMQNLRAALAMASSHVLSDLPIHRCLQTILHRKRTALDK